ncbi:hypothetical protein Btru_069736 [Bulinus truncatus]|nr:hypothetical protein Btru_069736 [Bulinus truncatus]
MINSVIGSNAETCAAYKFLCKEDFPKDRFNFNLEFHHFTVWWKENIFYERPKNTADVEKILDDLKVIVGRYVGLLSLVTVSSVSNFGSHRKEFRRKGQAAWYVGEKFSEILLTHTQVGYITQNCRLGYLCGPPGSGKTVVLVTRARRWILSTGNYVVVVNMYRGSRGRAIGKKIYKSVVSNSNPEKHQMLKDHCYEYAVNVDKFNRPKFVASIKGRWPDTIGKDGEKILFLVDETYVASYWSEVFTALREDFKESSLWCAGLYGAKPENFQSMMLNEVIRCPPQIQRILSLIDWNEERRKCYVTDSTTASLPTDGPMVMTVRHSEHEGFSHVQPSQCWLCGEQLLYLLQDQLNVEKPDDPHKSPDLRECTLKCSDVLFLVNMPRTKYVEDKGGYLDTTKDKFEDYMKSLWGCPMLKVLHDAGYPSNIHCNLKCSDLVGETSKEVINVAWIYTCQGLENTVIVFLPGDEGVSGCSNSNSDLLDPYRNIPCPGLQGKQLLLDSGSECSSSSEGTDGEGTNEKNFVGSDLLSSGSSQLLFCQGIEKKKMSQGELSIERFNFRDKDVERYSRWDKNNLFISASRCTSQLILITS